MDTFKIQIANILLTRRCHLQCDYCKIADHGFKAYTDKPEEYPDKKYYRENERDSSFWIEQFRILLDHNPDCFILLLGGEPVLYDGLADILNYLNSRNAAYSIISASSPELEKRIRKLFKETGPLRGWSASVDPGFWERSPVQKFKDIKINSGYKREFKQDQDYKSNEGYYTLIKLMDEGLIKDPVAEITATSENIHYLPETVKWLTKKGICSDITVVEDNRNSPYYDFSMVTNKELLIKKTEQTKNIFDELKSSDEYWVHMKDQILDLIYETTPMGIHCNIGEEHLSNITIDSDGKLRLCLRIRGVQTPVYELKDLLNLNTETVIDKYKDDYSSYCKGCSWTCILQSVEGNSDTIANH